MGKKALVVDDDPLMRRLCVRILELDGFQAITANNGREAIQLAMREAPQLIIMDIMMSGMTGLEALRQLKLAEATRSTPVIMITGEADQKTREQAAALGAASFLSKPFRAAQLLKAVRLILQPTGTEESD